MAAGVAHTAHSGGCVLHTMAEVRAEHGKGTHLGDASLDGLGVIPSHKVRGNSSALLGGQACEGRGGVCFAPLVCGGIRAVPPQPNSRTPSHAMTKPHPGVPSPGHILGKM